MALPKSLERRLDELQLAVMAALEVDGVVIHDDEGPVPLNLTERMTLGQMAFGSDEAATRAFHRLVTAYDGGNQ